MCVFFWKPGLWLTSLVADVWQWAWHCPRDWLYCSVVCLCWLRPFNSVLWSCRRENPWSQATTVCWCHGWETPTPRRGTCMRTTVTRAWSKLCCPLSHDMCALAHYVLYTVPPYLCSGTSKMPSWNRKRRGSLAREAVGTTQPLRRVPPRSRRSRPGTKQRLEHYVQCGSS